VVVFAGDCLLEKEPIWCRRLIITPDPLGVRACMVLSNTGSKGKQGSHQFTQMS